MIINTPISQDEYIKYLEDFIDNPNKTLDIKQDKLYKQSNPNQCLLNLSTSQWDNLITQIIKINPLNKNNQNSYNFGFNLLWNKLFINNQKYIKKEEFINKIEKLYLDVENLLGDDKFEEKNSKEWCRNKIIEIQNHGNSLNDLFKVISNKNDKTQIDEQLKSMIEQFHPFKELLEEMIQFVSSKVYSSIFGNLLTVFMLIYSTLIRDLISIGLDNEQSTTLLTNELHNRIMKFHKDLGNCCNKFCLSLIRPATTIIPWMNLPFNGQVIYGRINEMDLVQYPNPVSRVNDDYGDGIVNCNDNENIFKTFKVSPHYFNQSHGSIHIDSVSGYNPIWESFVSNDDFLNFNIIKSSGNEFINGYKIKIHVSAMYQGDSYFKVQVGDNQSGKVQVVNTKDLSNELISFQVMNFKMLYNVDLPYGIKELTSNDQDSGFKPHQKILNFRIFDVSNIVLNSIEITLE
ncbi:hypothetical protein DDB_G0267792 [Dictyostelium discoideum AX4]|uniref:Pesticidal crystal protein N-terminal domain-containing protein n=1 Tax=Dictyostelium discoideum TaxID=44689 RepID=Q55G72_DICDI|nr:hypothetical protein DDB_G0267792 [Dictyostelium discoideum AX4]EAL73349.1 hypothetical protein DDB_G0267792 [Dictyostelium discoideum AX4]|eukprot:XP_647311.1 hypothetical protein DDB_G0267792 [Dictyostelium discoideum AX4]